MDAHAGSDAAPRAAAAPGVAVHLALVAVQLAFSGFHVVAKLVLVDVPPLAVAVVRVGTATPLLLAMAWTHDRRVPPVRLWPRLALLGTLGIFLNQVLFLFGLQRTSATNAAILIAAIPVFTAAVAGILRIERPGPRRLAGIALAVAGSLAVLDPTRLRLGGPAVAGDAMILLNALCYAAFMVLQKPLLQVLPWRTVIAGSFLFGGAMTAAIGLPTALRYEWSAAPAAALWGIAYVAVIATAGAYALNTWAVRRSSPALAAAYTTLQPLGTAVLAAPLLGERLGVLDAMGCALIVAGLLLVSRARWREPPHPAAAFE